MAAFAQIIDSPIEPSPMFFNQNSCQGSSFPAKDGSSLPLAVIDEDVYQEIVQSGQPLPASVVNQLKSVKAGSTSFGDKTFGTILGFYVPPNYRIIFFTEDPSTKPPGKIVDPLEFRPGTLITNTCCSQLEWGQAKLNFLMKPVPPILPGGPPTQQPLKPEDCCADNFKSDAFYHSAPFLVVIRRESIDEMVVDACSYQRQISVGPYSLNQVWKPQTRGCDQFMSAMCAQPITADLADTCACFIQQGNLDDTYGPDVKMPVVCFGSDADKPGDKSKNCAFNSKSYKTYDMVQNSCSFAECQQLINVDHPAFASTGQIQCDGSFAQSKLPQAFVAVSVSTPEDDGGDTTLRKLVSHVPEWIWGFFGTGISLLLAFFVCLTFVA